MFVCFVYSCVVVMYVFVRDYCARCQERELRLARLGSLAHVVFHQVLNVYLLRIHKHSRMLGVTCHACARLCVLVCVCVYDNTPLARGSQICWAANRDGYWLCCMVFIVLCSLFSREKCCLMRHSRCQTRIRTVDHLLKDRRNNHI